MTGRPRLTVTRAFDATLVALAVVAVWHAVGTRAERPRSPRQFPPAIRVGTQLNFPGVDWSPASRHVVMRLSTSCQACNNSVGFYAAISEQIARKDTAQLTVVTTESEGPVRRWLVRSGIQPTRIVHVADASAYGFLLAPTLLLLDSSGLVTDVVIGEATPADETLLLRRLSANEGSSEPVDNTQYGEELSESDVAGRLQGGTMRLLDVRSRDAFKNGHRDAALNIPIDELEARAPKELIEDSAPIIVDCHGVAPPSCRVVARQLRRWGAPQVSLIIR